MNRTAFLHVANLLPDAVLLVGEDGVIQAAGRASAEVTGRAAGELDGQRLDGLVTEPPERVAGYLRLCAGTTEALPGALTFRRQGEPLECRCDGVLFQPAAAGTPAVILLRARPRHEVSSRFRALNETIDSLWREIATRREIEEALRGSEALTRRILSSTADCIAVLDLNGELLSVNDAGRAAFGLVEGETVAGRPWATLWQAEDRAAAARAVEEARATGTGRVTGRSTAAGGVRWWDVLITPILDAAGKAERLVAVARDVTERRHAEEQLRQSAKMEAIGRLAGGLAHDFNNHLHVQGGLLGFVLNDQALGEESRRDLLEVRAVTEHMASLTRQLLAFSRQQVLQLETLDLNRIVLEAQPLLQRLIGSTVEVELRLSPVPTWVQADRSQILQVLMNLGINARDAMSQGGRLEIATAHRMGREGDCVELTVSDTGSGIAPEHLPHVFEPFYTTKPVGEGTGLGLATVHGIVTQCRGQVHAESEPGVGTRFTILLPLHSPPEKAAEPPRRTTRRRASSGTILLVEDDEAVRTVFQRLLESEGFAVQPVRHGLEALHCLDRAAGEVQLVVSDVSMPVLGGREFARRLSREFPGIPVLWMSGHPLETDFATETLGREQPFLQKPVAPELLLDTIDRMLDAAPEPGRLRLLP